MPYWQYKTWTISWTHGTSCLKWKSVWIVGVLIENVIRIFVVADVITYFAGIQEMPIYEYKCEVCTNIEEQIQRHDVDEIECPVCNNTAKRIISLSSFELKGGGWYKDGYGTKKPESKPSPPKTSDGVTKAKPIKDE